MNDLLAALHRVLGYVPNAGPEDRRLIDLDIEPGGASRQADDPHGHEADHAARQQYGGG